MASPDATINIQIDQDALRKQINDTIQQELGAAAMSLIRAAHTLAPAIEGEQVKWRDQYADRAVANAKHDLRATIVSELRADGWEYAADFIEKGGKADD